MKKTLLCVFFGLNIAFLSACNAPKKKPLRAGDFAVENTSNRYTYTAKLIKGQIYLHLKTNPDGLMGPFIKQSDGNYTCEMQGEEGVRSLMRFPDDDGEWFYSWSYVQMRAERVDVRAIRDALEGR